MKFGCFLYILGIVALVIAFGFWGFNSNFEVVLFLILFSVWIFGGIFIYGIRSMKPLEELKKSPEQTANVKVIGKVTEVSGGGLMVGDDGSGTTAYPNPVIMLHFISFEFPVGTRKNFQVNVNQYNSVTENETGTLTYKEHENDLMFIDFQSQSQSEGTMDG